MNSLNNSSIAYTYVCVSSLNKCITFFKKINEKKIVLIPKLLNVSVQHKAIL